MIKAPAAPGPVTSAVEDASAFLACASTSRSRGTICVSTICAALPAVVFTAPITKPTKYSQCIDSHPSHQASGTVATVTAIDSSPTTYTGNLRTRSSHTPVGSENSTNGTISAAVSTPICVGEACSSTAADSGSASSVTWPPNEEMRIEIHKPPVGRIAQQIGRVQRKALKPRQRQQPAKRINVHGSNRRAVENFKA